MDKSLSIVMPAYNESKSIETSLRQTMEACKRAPGKFEIIVVNDCSTDNTLEIAQRVAKEFPEIRVITNESNLGFGGAFRNGVMHAKLSYVVLQVADDAIGSESYGEIISHTGEADMIIPYLANPEVRGFARRAVSWCYVNLINFLFGMNVRYYNGHNIFPTKAIQALHYTESFAYMVEIILRMIRENGLSMNDSVPMYIKQRQDGQTKAFKMKNVISVVRTIASLFWRLQIVGVETPAASESGRPVAKK